MFEDTQPTRRLDQAQMVRIQRIKSRSWKLWLLPALFILVYFFAPLRTNILLLGTDDSPQRSSIGRTDTIILTTIIPLKPYIGILSIPRDLWVQVPGVGEQRINTAYFFAEANQRGTGAQASILTVEQNFDVPVHYFAMVHMAGIVPVVDALEGVDIQLDTAPGGLPAGKQHLNGEQVLALIRDRSVGNDFGRMQGGQAVIQAILGKVILPSSLPLLPSFLRSLSNVLETNIPLWQYPRLIFALMRSVLFGMDGRTITSEMVTPFQTDGGAQVLAPNWDAINPLIKEMFGR
jgi:polyisoprenyl-teichoic acid--peptidoglycan teichoic acid transferase